MTDKEARIEAQRELDILKERLARCRLDVMRELKEQGRWLVSDVGSDAIDTATKGTQ